MKLEMDAPVRAPKGHTDDIDAHIHLSGKENGEYRTRLIMFTEGYEAPLTDWEHFMVSPNSYEPRIDIEATFEQPRSGSTLVLLVQKAKKSRGYIVDWIDHDAIRLNIPLGEYNYQGPQEKKSGPNGYDIPYSKGDFNKFTPGIGFKSPISSIPDHYELWDEDKKLKEGYTFRQHYRIDFPDWTPDIIENYMENLQANKTKKKTLEEEMNKRLEGKEEVKVTDMKPIDRGTFIDLRVEYKVIHASPIAISTIVALAISGAVVAIIIDAYVNTKNWFSELSTAKKGGAIGLLVILLGIGLGLKGGVQNKIQKGV